MNRIGDYQNLSEKIIDWIKNYAERNSIKSLVVGVSGGIDSAVVSILCARTGLNTFAVGMPLNSSPENTFLSEKHLNNLMMAYPNVTRLSVDLSETFEKFKSISEIKNDFNSELGFANTKSRLRMITLYQIATSEKGIVVGTGNKVEDFGVGFFTKYGDGGVDISPIADLYKSEVKELGRFLRVSDEIVNAEPTDGLWEDNRKDETQIGAKYEELEWVMEIGLNKWKNRPTTEREKKLVKTYLDFNLKNEHKMIPIPVFNLTENNIL